MRGITSDIESAGRGAKRFGSVLSPKDLIHNRNFNDGNEARQRTRASGAMSFAKYAKDGIRSAMKSMAFDWYQNGPNPFGPGLQESEDVNPRVILFGRVYTAVSSALHLSAADMGPPGEKELAIVYRQPVRSNNIVMSLDVGSQIEGVGPMIEPGFIMQGTPCLAATVLQWNYMMADMQYQWAYDDYEAYIRVPPTWLWHGVPKDINKGLYWVDRMLKNLKGLSELRGWSLDGAVGITAGDDGGAPMVNSGFRSLNNGALIGAGGSTKRYHVTVAAKGEFPMYDYWCGRGMTEGARLYFVCRKYESSQYERLEDNAKSLVFHLVSKPIDEDRDAAHMVRTIKGRVVINKTTGEEVDFCPHLLAPAADPSGSPLDRAHGCYSDENKERNTDGVFLHVGKVFSAPIRMTYKQPRLLEEVVPFMDGRKVLSNDPFQCIVDTDDGLRSIC